MEQMNAGKDEVVHEEVVAVDRNPGANLLAVFQNLDGAKPETAAERQSQVEPRKPPAARTDGVNRGGDAPGTREHQERVDEPVSLIQLKTRHRE
jgi:hypothetical protein